MIEVKIVNQSKFDIPQYADEGAAGFDLKANIENPIILSPLERVIIPTGLFFEIPKGNVGLICPRSGLAAKHGITVTNSPGVIDESYRGEIKVILSNISNDDYTIIPGERIAQMLITKYEKAVFVVMKSTEEFSNTERGTGGFGSTGKQ